MRHPYYILDGQTPVHEPDVRAWGRWFEKADRQVAEDRCGPVRISTVFLGLDHNCATRGPPALFETMIFGGPHDGLMWRASTWDEALLIHYEACARVGTPA